jgi:hypothetical protein
LLLLFAVQIDFGAPSAPVVARPFLFLHNLIALYCALALLQMTERRPNTLPALPGPVGKILRM